MSLVTVKGIEGVFSTEQKGEIIQKITDAMISVEGEKMRGVTWVVFEEVKSGEWGVGGELITTEKVKALQNA